MTSRAATTVAGLILIVVIACAALIPDQPSAALGIETALASAITLALALRSAGQILRFRADDAGLGLTIGKAALGIAPAAGSLLGSLLLCADLQPGLYIIAAAMIAGFAASTTNAWVLLVEILR